jgi:hypothetical protein
MTVSFDNDDHPAPGRQGYLIVRNEVCLMAVQQRAAARVSPLKLVFACTVAPLFFSSVFRVFTAPNGHDQSWYLFAAQRLLLGAKPYGPLLADTNPPLIIWFSTLPALLAHLLDIEPRTGLRLIVLLMISGTVAWCIRLVRGSPLCPDRAFPTLFGTAILLIELRPGSYDFAQREHLFVILSLPYIMAAITGATTRISLAERCALGVAAGVAVSFKPQEALVIVALELLVAVSTRSLRRVVSPEVMALIVTGALYLMLVRLITPLYQTEVVPILLNAYWAYGPYSALDLARNLKSTYFVVLTVLAACLALRQYLPGFSAVIAFLVCSVAASLAYYVQHITWSYHFLPCSQFLNLAACWLTIQLLLRVFRIYSRNLRFKGFSVALALITVELCVFTLCLSSVTANRRPAHATPVDELLARYQRPETIYIFSTGLKPFSNVFAHKLNWGSRFPCLWILPAIVLNEQPTLPRQAHFKQLPSETLMKLAILQRTSTTEDLNRWQPSIILVEHCNVEHPCQAIERVNFDILGWFLDSPDFAAAWSHYQRRPSLASFDVYIRQPTEW